MSGSCDNVQITDYYQAFNKIKPDYKYADVRVRAFWTRELLLDQTKVDQSDIIIATAKNIFESHTFRLDFGNLNNYNSVLPWDSPVGDDERVYAELHRLMDNATANLPNEENRLKIIFCNRYDGVPSQAVCKVPWLPFVIIHPKPSVPNALAHEIGHACRCSHTAGSVMGACEWSYTNFHNIHCWEIYRSYWCTGPRPQNWWETSYSGSLPNRSPYMWIPYDQPTRGTNTTDYQKML